MESIIGLALAKEVANLTWRDLFAISWEMILASIHAGVKRVELPGKSV
jgi:hypothetical protein